MRKENHPPVRVWEKPNFRNTMPDMGPPGILHVSCSCRKPCNCHGPIRLRLLQEYRAEKAAKAYTLYAQQQSY